ncbi:MAG: prepilin-type N-terminal cleavage/methylation domain-containing protein [Candidatus Omnitrophica bacterium]|nr:prepilin-type N-terminal cleavage/methylation domain-containing protein [Candidatus Omnitrophota bacterium]
MKISKGFSLVELMVAVAVLAIGLTVIYESFFIIADVTSGLPYYIKTQALIDEVMWEEENNLRIAGYLFPSTESGKIDVGNKKIRYVKKIEVLSSSQGLYNIDTDLTWKAGTKFINNTNSTYLRR